MRKVMIEKHSIVSIVKRKQKLQKTGGSSVLCSRRFNGGVISTECKVQHQRVETMLTVDKLRKPTLTDSLQRTESEKERMG